MKKLRKGFTLIELLLVVTIISLLAVAVFVALNPAQRLKDTKNARRTSDVDTILSAIHQSIIDNKGSYPSNMPATGVEAQLGSNPTGCTISNSYCNTGTPCADLMGGVQSLSKYLKELPFDPDGSPTYSTASSGYSVVVDTNGIVTVRACGAEGTAIYASR